jgi:hypothetical protein
MDNDTKMKWFALAGGMVLDTIKEEGHYEIGTQMKPKERIIFYKNPGTGRKRGARRLPFRLSRIVNCLKVDRRAAR